MSIRLILFLTVFLVIDFYIYHGLRTVLPQRESAVRVYNSVFWSLTVITLTVIVLALFTDWRSWPKQLRMYSFAIIVIMMATKLVFCAFLLVDDAVRLLRYAGIVGTQLFSKSPVNDSIRVSRLGFLVKFGAMLSAVPMVSLLYGMTGNTTRFSIRKLKLKLPGLPSSFEGFKAVQISDLHVGSFLSSDPLRKAIQLIHEQKPDVIFFTGDLVNDRHEEVLEHISVLRELKAPMGVYSVLGNHDYGDYLNWESSKDKQENLRRLKEIQHEFGWKLLLNNHAYLERDGERIGIIGVENWSARMNFKRYGDMIAATAGFDPAAVNILLSHDPSHWHAEVTSKYPFVDLTLSGHTHGFQFGVELPGFRWSPVQYVYREWADLYQSGQQKLYVNRGLGFIGYPGRVGILPEITVIEFQRA